MRWTRRRSDEDFAREVQAHIELETDRLVAEGFDADAARAAAVRAFGSPTAVRERFYESRRVMWLENVRRDVVYAVRTLVRQRAFTLVAMSTLALGIGANTAIFSVVNAVLLAPAPFRDMERLAMVWQTDRASGTTREPASIPDYTDFRRTATSFAGLAAFTGTDANVTPATGDPFRVAALAITHQFLPMLGLEPLAGRNFREDEDQPGGPPVVIIGEDLWERRFGRDPNLARHTMRLNDQPHAIVGVVPRAADFGVLQVLSAAAYGRSFADRGRVEVDVWLPLRPDPKSAPRDNHGIFVVGRLAPGVSALAAGAETSRLAADLEKAYPRSNEARGAFVEPLDAVVLGPVRPALYVLLAAVGLVLLVACVNVVNLQLARSASRAREVAVRTALGAGAARLAGQFLAEGLVLCGGAAVVGLLFARWVLHLLVRLAPAGIPRVANVTIDVGVLGATLAIALVAAMGVGIVPALQARRVNVHGTLKAEAGRSSASGGRGRRRLQSGLVVVQVGLAVMLAIGAGLLIRSFWHLRTVDPGFRADNVLKAEYQLPESRYPLRRQDFPNWPEGRRFHQELIRRAAALPGVEHAAVAGDHPLAAGFTNSFVVVGREAEARGWPEISLRFVSADYARVTGQALLAGRHVSDADTIESLPVVLINQEARRQFFPGQDPIGQQIAFWGTKRTIVGVVADEKIHGLEQGAPPAAYVPLNQAPLAQTLLVRVHGDPLSFAPAVRKVFRDMDPALAVFGVEPLRQTVADSLGERRFTMLLLGAFAGVTLLLAVLGVYGVLSYGVAQRRGEIGVRMALGAEPGTVQRLVIGQGLALVFGGLVLGVGGSLLLTRLLRGLLFGITPTDPLAFAAASILLLLTAVLASYLPARRASKVEPVVALRAE